MPTDDYGPYRVHPVANAFPLIDGPEFSQLVDDIRDNGLQEPIWLSADEETIIDGRNRYRACMAAGVDPNFRTIPASWDELSIIEFIISLNIRRRHMSAGQLGFLALELEGPIAVAAKARHRVAVARGGAQSPYATESENKTTPNAGEASSARHARESADLAARMVGTSRNSVQRAKSVRETAPELAQQVMSGNLAVANAYQQARHRARAQPKPEQVRPTSTMLTLRTHDGTPVMYPQPQAKAQFNRSTGEGISWAGWSWNPVTGCLHGCDYCYARELATKESYRAAYPVGFTPLFHHERLSAPANTPLPQGAHGTDLGRVFVCSMADLYGRWVPQEWIDAVHESERANPQWQYLHLTKFPDRYVGLDLPSSGWIGTSVDEQRRVRIAERAFSQIEDVAVRWLSLEPLLAPLEFTDLSMFDWVVIGAQTETRQPTGTVPAFAPPFEWVARIVAQAREAGCKVHMKPNLLGQTNPGSPGMQLINEYPGPAA